MSQIDDSVVYMTAYGLQFVGTPYRYGGNNPMQGLDCSGLVCEILKSAGKLKWNEDLTAQQLYDRFSNGAGVTHLTPEPGCLVFFGKDKSHIGHVGFLINQTMMLEAGGGDATTITKSDAEARNAFVRIRPYDYRRDRLAFAKPI